MILMDVNLVVLYSTTQVTSIMVHGACGSGYPVVS
jgi:hypothetical protein